MMLKPWDCAQPDEWLPQSLRLCWGGGGFGGDSGGGGFSGDSGGWGGDSGATTGGGDWGSSGSYDASGFNAGGDLGAFAGTAYDASTAGTGMGGGGDWGSFGDTSYASFNAPNPTFADVAGPNPGVTTGGGDWGSAGAFSAAGTGGGPAGAMLGAAQGAGAGFWGGGEGGGPFGDYGGGGGGGGGGGYYGGGGGQQGGGSFGSFGTGTLGASNAVSAVSGPAFADTAGPGSLAGPAGQASSGAPTTSEAQSESAGGGETTSDGDAAPSEDGDTSVAPSESQFGEPAQAEAAPEAEAQTAAPEVSSTIAGGRETNFDYGPQAAPAEQDAGPSSFGPQSVNADYEGSPYADMGPSQGYQQAAQTLSDLTQSALQPDEGYQGSPYATLAPQDVNWGSVFEASSDPGYQPDAREGPMGPIADPGWFQSIISDIPGVTTPAWAQDVGRSLSDVNTWLAPQNQGAVNFLTSLNWDPSTWANVAQPWTAFDQQALGEQGKAGQIAGDLASQLGIENVGATQGTDPSSEQYGTEAYAPGGIDPSAEQYGVTNQQDLASQLGIQDIDTVDWGSVFEAPELGPDYASVFEGTPSSPDWGAVFEGAPSVDPNAQPAPEGQPSVDALPGGQPGAPPTTDDASTPGGDPALSGASAAAAAAAGAPGILGQPTEGQPGTQGQPATAPAQGGPTFVTDAAVSAIANATSNAALDVGAPPQAGDAASQAAHNAALNLNSPAEIAAAASEAALANGATQAQADAIAAAALNAANSQTGFTPGQPGQQQQAPPGQQQPGAPEGEQTTSTTSAFIPGGLQTNFEYEGSQPAPPSLIEQAPAQPGVPMPQARPAEAPPGLVDMLPPPALTPTVQPSVPIPQSRPAEAPSSAPTTARVGPFVGIVGRETSEQADTAGKAADAGAGRAIPANPNTGMPGLSALNVPGGRARQTDPVAIVTHYTGGKGYTIGSLVSQMAKGGAGYNYAVDKDGKVYQLRPDDRTAGHVGPGKGNTGGIKNANSIGVSAIAENESDLTPAQIAAMKDVVAALGRQFGISPSDVRGHGVVSPSRREHVEGSTVSGWAHGLTSWKDAPTSRPPAGIPDVRTAQPTATPTEQPPTETPAALPPVAPPDPVAPRPPADILAPTLTPPARGRADPVMLDRAISNITTQALRGIDKNTTKDAAIAKGAAARAAMIQAGVPLSTARAALLELANQTAARMGYARSDYLGAVGAAIDKGIAEAMQGYQPAKPGEVQGPPAPAAPGKQGALPSQQYADLSQSLGPAGRQGDVSAPSLQQLSPLTAPPQAPPTWGQPPALPPPPQYRPGDPGMFNPFRGNEAELQPEAPFGSFIIPVAGGRDVGARPAIEPGQQPGRAEWEAPLPGELGANLDPSDALAPTDPRSETAFPPTRDRGVFDPDILQWDQQQRQEYEQNLDPRGWQQATLNFLQNFNPISTAEAKGRGRDGALQQALALAREGGNFGGQRGMSVVGKNVFTFYAPGASGSKGTEGPMIGSKGNPLTTLDDVRNGAGFVSLAGHPAQFGQQVFIGDITYTSPVDGKQYTLNNVVGRVDDTGGKFGGRDNPDQNHFDIAVGDFSRGWNDRTAGSFVAGNYATAVPGRGIGSDYAADDQATAVGAQPPVDAPPAAMRGLAKGGHVKKDEPVVVGEEGPETFVPDTAGTVVPHMPPGGGGDFGRWPKLPTPDYPGRYAGVGREMKRQMREAQDPIPTLMDLVDSGRLPLNAANWHAMLNDPGLIALGQSRIGTVDEPAPAPAAEPPDPTSPMAQALGYGSIRRPMRIGRQSYQQ